MSYDNFDELQQAARTLKSRWSGNLQMGMTDFKSAFKTLPPSKDQKWLCWSLVFDPVQEEYVVIPIQSQAFGSLGAVVAWFRTAKMIQAIVESLFGLVIFCYVRTRCLELDGSSMFSSM